MFNPLCSKENVPDCCFLQSGGHCRKIRRGSKMNAITHLALNWYPPWSGFSLSNGQANHHLEEIEGIKHAKKRYSLLLRRCKHRSEILIAHHITDKDDFFEQATNHQIWTDSSCARTFTFIFGNLAQFVGPLSHKSTRLKNIGQIECKTRLTIVTFVGPRSHDSRLEC